jgi:hypothetical protein
LVFFFFAWAHPITLTLYYCRYEMSAILIDAPRVLAPQSGQTRFHIWLMVASSNDVM